MKFCSARALAAISAAGLLTSTSAYGQQAGQPAGATVLPPVEVTPPAAPPKAKRKQTARPKAAPKSQAPAPAATVQAAPNPTQAGTTRAEGPENPTSHVDGYVAKTSSVGTKTGAPLIETPQSISVVTSDQIQDQGAQTLAQALRYTPGVVVELNGAGSRYSEARIRGFTPIHYLDGLAVPLQGFFATPRIEPYGLERVEVLKGPASFLYGQNSPGGLLNMISKRPTETPLNEVFLQFGSFDRVQTGFDFAGPAGPGKNFLYRVTGVFRDASTEVDHTRDDLAYIAPAFTWKPSEDTTFTLLGHYSADYGTFPHQYVPAQGSLFWNPNGRISRSTFLGEPGWDRFDREQWTAGYELEHKFGHGVTFRSNARASGVDQMFRAHRVEGLQADLQTVERGAYELKTDAMSYAVDNQLQTDFRTGPLAHQVLMGVDYYRLTGNYNFSGAFPPIFGGTVQPINIFNPVYGAVVPPLATFQRDKVAQDQVGIYAQDQIKLGGWVLTLGGRQDWAENETTNQLAGSTTKSNDDAFTGRAGLTYVFDNGIAPYVSYGESFLPVAGVSRLGTPFEPSTGRQYEAGIKYQPPGTKTLITAAVFDIVQSNVLTTDTADPTFQVQTGEVQVRGFDIDVKANLTRNLEVLLGYAYLDSEVTKSNIPSEIGNPLIFAPMHQATAWAKYSFHEGPFIGLSLGAGVRYLGEVYAPLLLPDLTLVDTLVSYDLKHVNPVFKGAELSLNVTNLFDKYYIQGYCDPVYCSLGEGRVVLGSLRYRW